LAEQDSEIKWLRKQSQQQQQKLNQLTSFLPTLEKWRERLTDVIKRGHEDDPARQNQRVLEQIYEELGQVWNNLQTITAKANNKVEYTADECSKEADTTLWREEVEHLKVERAFLGRQVARLRYQLDKVISTTHQEAEKAATTTTDAAGKKDEQNEDSVKTEDSAKEQELLKRCKEAESLADSRLKELQETLEDQKRLAVELERLKSERLAIKKDDITQSAIYCSLEAAFQKLQLQQIEWERERGNLKKEKDELERIMEEKYGLQIQRLKRKASEWKQQLEDAIHTSNEAKSQRDQALMRYEAKKLEAENESKVENLHKSIAMLETKSVCMEWKS
jgi:hypothetical protein